MKRILASCLVAVAMAARPASAQVTSPITTETPTAAPDAATPERGVAKGFARDVLHDYKDFFSGETALWLGIGGDAALAVHGADESIFEWTTGSDAFTLPGGGVYGSQLLHVPVAIAWWAIGSAVGRPRDAEAGRDLLRAQISVFSWTYAVKFATQRTRPNGDPHSFPSGHASTTFATAMVLQEHYGWKAGLPAFIAASYASISRVTDQQHWASDVVFGAVLGMASARTVTINFRGTRASIAPLAVPSGGGVIVVAMR